MSNDHTDNLLKVMGIEKYSGCLIYKEGSKYYVWGKEYPTLYLAKKAIDLGIVSLRRKIIKQQRLREEAENNSDE